MFNFFKKDLSIYKLLAILALYTTNHTSNRRDKKCIKKFRRRALAYWHEGHTLFQTREVFKISVTTLYKWEHQLKEEGNLSRHKVHRPEKLKEY